MRILLFFDLPVKTVNERREYTRFRKFLITNGYIMMQESVYSKLSTNYNACEFEIEKVRKHKPNAGIIQCLVVTENQYAGIINIGKVNEHSQIDSMDRLIII